MNDTIIWLTMRKMRTPLVVMILVYVFSVFGMVMIPGQDDLGNAIQVGYLDAAYFIAILATTIGLGEMPTVFTGAQRLYVYLILLPNVVAWLYSVGTILGLFLDPQFRNVLHHSRFARRINRLTQGFYIVCGFGNTGMMLVNALHQRDYGVVVLEKEEDVIHAMALSDTISHIPALAADVTDRRMLELAGLRKVNCLGVIAITNEDHANLTIAITSKLLRPELPVMARAETLRVTANMASFDTDHVVDPYSIFAERLFLAIISPTKYLTQDWLISVPGSELRQPLHPPNGRWIICGMGRFGSRIAERLDEAMLPYTIIDVHPDRVRGRENAVQGRGTEAETLLEAGVKEAVGIVAGTGDDVDNLSIVLTARSLNPKLFVVARQERRVNDALFDASGADLVARRALIVARRILMVATTPLLQTFLRHLVSQKDEFSERVIARLRPVLNGLAPVIWTSDLSGQMSLGLEEAERASVKVQLAHILRHSRTLEAKDLPCICLLLERGASRIFLPDNSQELHIGDRLLFAGRDVARCEVEWSLSEPQALMVNATGKTMARGALWRWLEKRRKSA
jgi:voltage-gated potassium channel